jgi:hypothetical protein
MTPGCRLALFLTATVALLCLKPAVLGDEGLWLFNGVPKDELKKKYDFDVEQKWLDHVQRSSVRFNSGGSGSFVSPNGLTMTNHHVAADALQKMGTKDRNPYRDGFHAKTRAEEYKCQGMELNVLMAMVDVTDRVNKAVTPDMTAEKAALARRAVMNAIEKESTDKTKQKSQVVTLYQGGAYHLYRFKKYTDVRLVFAPEQQIAFYGGDPDNFEYPRYDLDVAFFRVYENDKPSSTPNYLKWSTRHLRDDDLVFVSGHPGRTSRLATLADLDYQRDVSFPYLLQRLNRLEVLLSTYSDRSEENRRQAKELFFGVQNSRKARIGGLAALLDPYLMDHKKKQEARFKKGATDKEELKSARTAWDRIAASQKVRKANLQKHTLLEKRAGFMTEYFDHARTLVRAGDERAKPNNERLREYSEANLESMQEDLVADNPSYPEYEIALLTDSLTFLASSLGHRNPLVRKVLDGKAPQARARELVKGTRLADAKVRKALWEGGRKAVDESKDPMIELARLVDADARAVRKIMETEDEVTRQAYGEIAKVQFALDGTKTYPDATFTLRLSFGQVKGYEEDGKKVPFTTTFAGMYQRSAEHKNKGAFELPKRWLDRKKDLDLKTPFNFVCTVDIIGGNSGSPVINRNAEVVGLIFDGNIQSLAWDFLYDERQGRSVAVAAPGIIEALRKIYDANDLADEVLGKKPSVSRR